MSFTVHSSLRWVASIASHAEVTTGSLYHHFGSKQGLYYVVRTDVEQRVIDRLEGAAATTAVGCVSELASVLLVGSTTSSAADSCDSWASRRRRRPTAPSVWTPSRNSSTDSWGQQRPMPALVAAAWRTALWHASDGPDAAHDARAALAHLLAGS